MSENGMRRSVGFSIMGMIKNYFFWSIIIALLAMNVASVASASFNHSMFRLLSNLPFSEFLSNSPALQQKRLVSRNNQLIKSNVTLSKSLQKYRLDAKGIVKENKRLKTNAQNILATKKQLSVKNKNLIKNNGMLVEKLQKAEMTLDVFRAKNKRLNQQSMRRLSNVSQAWHLRQRVALRTAKNLGYNLASMAGEVVPVAGAALIVAVTTKDIIDACSTEKDINAMMGLMDGSGIVQNVQSVCGMKTPTSIGTTTSRAISGTKENAHIAKKVIGKTFYDAVEYWRK